MLGRVSGVNVRKISSVAGSSSTVSTDAVRRLRKIAELCKQNPDFVVKDKLYKLLYDANLYEIAYQKLKSNPGNMTPGINPTTLDGMSSEVAADIAKRIKTKKFEFTPGRRTIIPKAKGGSRPLTIASPRDKLVPEAIRMILEAIYEPSFSESSHGFRTGKGCHSALKEVKTKFAVAR